MSKQLSSDYVGYSVSWGTMVTEDLIKSFLNFIGNVASTVGISEEDVITLNSEAINVRGDEEMTDYFLHEELWPLLDEIAPEGCYFDSHPGDGSDYGFWEIDDAF